VTTPPVAAPADPPATPGEVTPIDNACTSRGIRRRSLLTAGAGVLLGAGLTEAGNGFAGITASPARRPPSPGEDLMTEHGVLKRLLLAYQAAADQLSAGTAPPAGAISDAAQVISDYIEGFHEGLEEAYVFPRVRAVQSQLISTLLTQHDRGRHLTAAISAIAADDLTSATARSALQNYLTLFVRMYAPHEAWEDTVVFPALRQLTPQRTLDQLAERFNDLQNKQYGDDALTQMLQRVTGIEEQLGINNLATFTPPEIQTPP
jgi:hemerythrin-like domain-containing protein